MKSKYPECFDGVSVRCDAIGFEALNEKEKAIYSIWWLEAEVNNGGFHQYFWNSAGDHAMIAMNSLIAIGAKDTAEILQRAVKVAFSGTAPLDRYDRQNVLEVDEERKEKELDKLDSEFQLYTENFYDMLNRYIEA